MKDIMKNAHSTSQFLKKLTGMFKGHGFDPLVDLYGILKWQKHMTLDFVISLTDKPHFHLGYLIKPRGKIILGLLNLIWITYFTKHYMYHLNSQN